MAARARHFSTSGLFGGLGSFAELEARITDLVGNKERGDAFEVFAEAYLATQKINQSLAERNLIKRQTIQHRRSQHRKIAA